MSEVYAIAHELNLNDDAQLKEALAQMADVSEESLHYEVLRSQGAHHKKSMVAGAMARSELERRDAAALKRLTFRTTVWSVCTGILGTVIGAVLSYLLQ